MPDGLQTYHLYRMNAHSGEMQRTEEIAAFSDDEAIGRALDEAGNERIELWHGDRKLAAISCGDGPSELTIAPPEGQWT